jgi:23S rRNA pseudouridine1911/1915/1917 synthase
MSAARRSRSAEAFALRLPESTDATSALRVLYEDDHLLAVDKPAGMVVHPAYKNPAGTLLDAILWRARDWPSGHRPSIVGRLDKLTSGIVILAKSAESHAALQRTLASRASAKDYLAVVYGVPDQRGEIDLPLAFDPNDRRRIVVADGGWRSTTEFERLSQVTAPRVGLSLLRCRLITGRRHQIRAHLAARGWPIVGDAVYCQPRWRDVEDPSLAAALQSFPRQALHAWRVAFTHPISGARVTIEAPLPRDVEALLELISDMK